MRILFLEDDGMTGLAPYVRALGHEPVVLRSGAYDGWHADECRDPALEVHRVAPEANAQELLDAAMALRPDALISLALLDPHCWRDALVGDYFRQVRRIPVVANPPATVLLANDKLRTKQLLCQHRIAVTEGVAVGDLDQARAAAQRLGYPLILKRNDGYAGIGMRLCADDGQLQRYYRRQPGPMLAEHFIEGVELSVDVLRWEGRSRALGVVHKGATDRDLRRHPIYRLRQAPAPIAPEQYTLALEIAVRAMDALGIVGIAECEMILDPVRGPLVLEVNPRIAGTARLSAACAGIDVHRCLVDMVLGRFDADRLRGVPGHAVQIPVHAPIAPAALARLAALPAVRFIKHINWAPDLGISASLTVAAPGPAALQASLREIGSLVVLEPARSAPAPELAATRTPLPDHRLEAVT
jgi:biotin carboxylase